MLNAASGKNAFRGFASKLREQAKDVVGNVKLPSFDDMAKNDDYIHSPDFNVRSSGRRRQEDVESGSIISGSIISTSNNGNADEASHYSTESSWSLLDRSSNTSLVAGGKTAAATTTTTTTTPAVVTTPVASTRKAQNIDRFQSETSSSRSIGQSTEATPSESSNRPQQTKSSVSLLSVVSDALQPTTPVQTAPGGNDYIRSRLDRHGTDEDSDQSSQDFDEEDPILSMLQKEKNPENTTTNNTPTNDQAPTSVITIKKSSNRFMDDVRLQAPVDEDQSIDGIIKVHETESTSSVEATTTTTTKTSFGGFFKHTAALQNNFKRMVLRKDDAPSQQQQQSKKRPPLARERTTKAQPQSENFQITSATSAGMLGNDDLEQLKQLKLAGQSSSACSSIANFIHYIQEHRHSLFATFTLLLAMYVYFRKF